VDAKMEEKVVIAVCGYPELYDTTCLLYRDCNKKEQAWVKVAEETGVPVDQCRKKWKSLRDTYLKERRKEAEKRSGAAAGPVKRWKYSAALSFLNPFITPREKDRAAGYRESEAGLVEDQGEAAGPSGIESGGLLTDEDAHR
ncbi:transcription factor Adf-1-like, partial [Epinephelus fuscoguttatus]|uniref:transcription factor Adf-1-like n=1 Tax=Epinephelus fuscoguttatus TaxID=293821 RepID=UPI0020D185FA